MIALSAPPHILRTSLRLSGSKSISNRLLMLKEILQVDSDLVNLSDSEDTNLLKKALEQVRYKNKESVDIHHAGTDMRFLTAFLATREGEWTLTGSGRMKERPIGELVNALTMLGAEIRYLEKSGFPPLLIHGKKLSGGRIEMDSSLSSQFVSALLLIAPKFEKSLDLHLKGKTVSRPYIEMTISLLKSVGVNVEQKENQVVIQPSVSPFPFSLFPFPSSIYIESDWSSASYWYNICALAGNAEIELIGLSQNSLQADSVLPGIYRNLGVETIVTDNSLLLRSCKPGLKEFSYDFTDCPDIAQTLAVTCFGLGIEASLTGLSTLKVKETDRILALKNELEKCGARIEAGADHIDIFPNPEPGTRNSKSILIKTYSDHRMAMSFAPLAFLYKELRIEDPDVVVKSYPRFWEDLISVGFNVNLQP